MVHTFQNPIIVFARSTMGTGQSCPDSCSILFVLVLSRPLSMCLWPGQIWPADRRKFGITGSEISRRALKEVTQSQHFAPESIVNGSCRSRCKKSCIIESSLLQVGSTFTHTACKCRMFTVMMHTEFFQFNVSSCEVYHSICEVVNSNCCQIIWPAVNVRLS